MDEVIDRLSKEYAHLSPRLQSAALAVLNNPSDVAVHSMRTIAARASVSPPTMLRLAQRLGFENYETFREVFRTSVIRAGYGDRALDLREAADKEGIAGLIEATVAAAATGMERFHDPAFARDVERVADIIVGSKRTFVLASGASFGQAVSFHYVCRMALPTIQIANGLGVRSIDDLAFVSKDDAVLAITTAPYARSTVEAATLAKQRGAQVVSVTDSRASPVGRFSDAAITIETHSPHYFPSMMSLSATLEVLSAVISVKRGHESIQAISDYEDTLRDSAYYWSDPDSN